MKNVGVFFGSRSPEHDVSIITGEFVISGLKGLGYEVTPIYITKDGSWLIDEKLGQLKSFTDSNNSVSKEKKYGQYFLDLENSKGKMVFQKKGITKKTITVDLAFPALHGSFGEDGTIQGLFEMLNIPYVGCNVSASAVAMDKAMVKELCSVNEIPITKYVCFLKEDWDSGQKSVLEKIKKELEFPVFVKPVHLGSSIGISKVEKIEELADKIEVALCFDNKVLVEEGVTNLMDVTCCLLGNREVEASLLQESTFDAALFDFDEKYIKGTQIGKGESGLVIPARLDSKTTKAIQDVAIKVYKMIGATGIARVDFLYNQKTKKFFGNEVNPLPGTLYHHLWKESGIEFSELLQRLINLAIESHTERQKSTYTFDSSLLTNLNSVKLNSKKLKSE